MMPAAATRRRGTSRDPSWGPPTAGDDRRMKQQLRARDRAWQDVYEEGVKEGRHEAKGKAKAARPRRPARRRRPVTRRVARELTAPLSNQLYSGVRTLGLMLGVVALFLLLQNANSAAGLVGSLSKGLEWLRAADRSIPYAST